jgi:hypothetical protein
MPKIGAENICRDQEILTDTFSGMEASGVNTKKDCDIFSVDAK